MTANYVLIYLDSFFLKLNLPHFIPINKVENNVPEMISADFLRKSNLPKSFTDDELLKKAKINLDIRKKSSKSKGIEPTNFAQNKTKNKLVYTTLSLKRIDGVLDV